MGNIDYDYLEDGSVAASAVTESKNAIFSQSVLSVLVIIIGVLVLIALSISIVNLIMSIRMNRRIGNISSKLGTIQSDKMIQSGLCFVKSVEASIRWQTDNVRSAVKRDNNF